MVKFSRPLTQNMMDAPRHAVLAPDFQACDGLVAGHVLLCQQVHHFCRVSLSLESLRKILVVQIKCIHKCVLKGTQRLCLDNEVC